MLDCWDHDGVLLLHQVGEIFVYFPADPIVVGGYRLALVLAGQAGPVQPPDFLLKVFFFESSFKVEPDGGDQLILRRFVVDGHCVLVPLCRFVTKLRGRVADGLSIIPRVVGLPGLDLPDKIFRFDGLGLLSGGSVPAMEGDWRQDRNVSLLHFVMFL